MFRIVNDPPSAHVGNTPIRLIAYSDSIESMVEAPLSSLRGIKVNQYPPMLSCTLVLEDADALDELEQCYLYRERPGNGIRLDFHFGSPEGVWRNDVAVGAAYRELVSLPDFAKYQRKFEIDHNETSIFFTQQLKESSRQDLHAAITSALSKIRRIVAAVNARLFGFSWKTEYETDEPLFTKEVVIPLLRRMGFEGVRYNHGVSEFGRDVLFADLDKFSNVRHYAAQVKAGGIAASNGTLLNQLIVQIDDAFAMPVQGPGKSKQFHVSEVFVICSGRISDGAVERLNQKLDPRLFGSVHFLAQDVMHLAQAYLRRQ